MISYRNRYLAHADMDGEQIAAVWRDGQWLWFYDDTALPAEATIQGPESEYYRTTVTR